MEFKINTDLSLIPKKIDFNAEELKAQLAERLGYYDSLVVTEDAIKDAKADRAALNKLKTAMESRRKEVKAACNAPYEDFKRQYDEVLAMIQKPINAIDKQIRAFDDKRKDEKLKTITEFWNQNVGECGAYVSFKQVFDTKWLNATFPMGDIHNAIMAAFIKTEDDVKAIRDLHSEFETAALEEYAQTRSIPAAIEKIRRLEERRAAEQAKKQATNAALMSLAVTSHIASEAEKDSGTTAKSESAETFTVDFRVTATDLQLKALKAFLRSNNISYGHVPEKE